MKRLLSMLLAGVMCVSMLAGCGSSAKDNTPVVMTIDGEEVQSSELAAYIVYNMQYYQSMLGLDSSYFADEEMFNSIKEGCQNQAVSYRAVKKLAEQLGVTLSSSDEKKLKENKKSNEEYMGAETNAFSRWLKYTVKGEENPFITYLNSYGYTEELYDANCETVQLESAIADYYYSNGDTAKYFNENYVHAKSILISDQDKDGNALSGDALKKAKATAQDVLKQVQDGGNFDDLWSKYNSDTAQPENGYYFKEGDMVDDYYKAAKALKADEVTSKLVYYEGYGWFIIKALAMDEAALTDTAACLDNQGDDDDTTLVKTIGQTLMETALTDVQKDMDIQTNEEYDKITATNVNTYLPFTMDSMISGSGSEAGSAAAS